MITPGYIEISDALLRAGIYQSLAGAFADPGPDSQAALDKRWQSLLGWNSGWPIGIKEALEQALKDHRAADPSVLAEEYVRLFGPAARCPLTETSWGDAGRLLGKAAQIADVSGFYQAFMVQPRACVDTVPEDHLAMELEFMSVLCLKEAHALNAGLEEQLVITRNAQNKFLEEHLAGWIDYWCESLQANTPASFYHSLAAVLQSLLHFEIERLGLKPQPIRARVTDREAGNDTFDCPLATTP